MITLEQLDELPLYHRATITKAHLDVMGHLNVRWYMAMFDDASWNFFASYGMDESYCRSSGSGGFALKQFIHYLAEVREGERIGIRSRVLGRSAKRIHFMHFMINESTGVLAATLEGLGAHADLRVRRTAPYPPHIAAKIDQFLDHHSRLGWEAPVCGVIWP
jgi:acyl-CoA thioester hydrolase